MMLRTNLYFPQEDLCFLKKMAEEQGLSMAQYIRKIVEEKKAEKKAKKTMANPAKSLLRMAKNAGRSRFRDLGINHDKYLYGEKRIE